jgi:diacylglycerol kinase family enzyme
VGRTEKSPFVHAVHGRSFDIRFRKPLAYELDGGTRPPTDRIRIKVRPASVIVCVPAQ